MYQRTYLPILPKLYLVTSILLRGEGPSNGVSLKIADIEDVGNLMIRNKGFPNTIRDP